MRRSFRCQFNSYVGQHNRDGIIASLISQFESYDCDPQVILDDNGFTLMVNVNEVLTPELVKSKLAFNYFIKSVTTGDKIRLVRKMVVPIAGVRQADEVGVEKLKDEKDDTGVNAELPEARIVKLLGDGGIVAGLVYADPSERLPGIYFGDPGGPGIAGHSVVPENISDINDVEDKIKLVAFLEGGPSQFGDSLPKTNQREDVTKIPAATRGLSNSSDLATNPIGIAGKGFFNVKDGEGVTPTGTQGFLDVAKVIEEDEENPAKVKPIDDIMSNHGGRGVIDGNTAWFASSFGDYEHPFDEESVDDVEF
jgi:hypothetical protein